MNSRRDLRPSRIEIHSRDYICEWEEELIGPIAGFPVYLYTRIRKKLSHKQNADLSLLLADKQKKKHLSMGCTASLPYKLSRLLTMSLADATRKSAHPYIDRLLPAIYRALYMYVYTHAYTSIMYFHNDTLRERIFSYILYV